MFLPDKIEEEIFSFMGITYKNKRCKATKLDGKVCTRKTKILYYVVNTKN